MFSWRTDEELHGYDNPFGNIEKYIRNKGLGPPVPPRIRFTEDSVTAKLTVVKERAF